MPYICFSREVRREFRKMKIASNADTHEINAPEKQHQEIHRYYSAFERLTENQEFTFKAIDLLCSWRFDIMAKYIYAKYRELGVKNDWAQQLYAQHLKVWGNFNETWPRKSGLNQFMIAFHEILNSIKARGFCPHTSIIPIDKRKIISNGSHRIAACILYKQDVICKYYAKWQAPLASAEYFRKNNQYVKGGLAQKYLDAMALEYCMLKENTYMVHIFPIASGNDDKVRLMLNEYGNIVYEKDICLHHHGPFNYIKLTYQGDSWLGNSENNFQGARNDAQKKFSNKTYPMRVFLFECDNLPKIRECKNRLRSLFNVGNYSIHINDTHEQTIELAQTLFNDNSIHLLNWAKQAAFSSFDKFVIEYHAILNKLGVNKECFCVDGSAVLSAYGIRECKDLDFLHHGYDQVVRAAQTKFISSHNSSIDHHTISLDDIVFNPDNYFYYKGLKFAALSVVKNMKTKRNDEKDKIDLKLIENHFAVTKGK